MVSPGRAGEEDKQDSEEGSCRLQEVGEGLLADSHSRCTPAFSRLSGSLDQSDHKNPRTFY